MHFVCVYTTGRNVWLLLKYYLHGFVEEEEEEKSLYSNQQRKSHCVCDVWAGGAGEGGLCLPPSPKLQTAMWLYCKPV